MQGRHYHASLFARAALLAVLVLAVFSAACAGGGGILDDKFAWRVEGGALTDYAGTDGEDAAARNLMRLALVGRQYDLTPVVSNLAESGAIHAYRAGADASFADADGTQLQFGDELTLDCDLASTSPDITGAHLTGVYSKNAAEAAISNPSASFTMAWTFSYLEAGAPRELTAQQTLIGINYILD